MKGYLKKVFAAIVITVLTMPLGAQISWNIPSDSIKKNFIFQSVIFPQEKVYVQNDKPYYVTGEDIWFRAYLVDAISHVADYSSRYIYAELINPVNEVSVRIKIKPTLGAYSGYIKIPEEVPSGDYQLRFYTKFMENVDDAYFFKKKIRIGDPLGALYRTEATFSYDTKDNVIVRLQFIDVKTGKHIYPDEVRIKNDDKLIASGGQKYKKYSPDSESGIEFELKEPKKRYGNYLYIEYDYLKKFHKEYIAIPSSDSDFDVTFLPEGGNFPAGVSSIVAFKSLNANGMGEDINGWIENGKGEQIVEIKSMHAGMGLFALNATAGEKYYAVCKNGKGIEKRYELPPSVLGVHSLKTNWQKEQLYISVNKSAGVQPIPLYLIIHCRGSVLYAAPWDNAKEYINIDRKLLPSGVIHIILSDANLNPLSERLVFSRNEKEDMKLAFNTDKAAYGKREKVKAAFSLADKENRPAMASLSVSVTDDKDVNPETGVNILSYLLLSSELRGYIESPAYYFTDVNNTTIAELDVLMMTQGWRRYNIPNVLKGKYEEPVSPLEIGQEISGTVTSVARKRPENNAEVGIFSTGANYFDLLKTDKDGRFAFKGFEHPEGTSYLLRANKGNGNDWVRLTLDEETFPDAKRYGSIEPLPSGIEKVYEAYLEKADNKYVLENGMRMIYLKEVEVTATKKKRYMATGPVSVIADKSYNYQDIEEHKYFSIRDILQRTAGVMILGDQIILRTRTTIGISSGSSTELSNGEAAGDYSNPNPEPGIFIDGVYIDPELMGGSALYFLEQMNIHDIKQVDILKSNTVLFGYRGAKGVINITMKDGSEPSAPNPMYNMATISPLGYQPVKEFYSPKYDTPDQKNVNTPDLRTTIYWNPNVKVSPEGKADIEFYTADSASTYSVVVEGVTIDGQLVHAVEKIDCTGNN